MSNRNRFEVTVPDQLLLTPHPNSRSGWLSPFTLNWACSQYVPGATGFSNSSSVTGGSQYLAKSTAIENLEPAGRGRNIGPTQPPTNIGRVRSTRCNDLPRASKRVRAIFAGFCFFPVMLPRSRIMSSSPTFRSSTRNLGTLPCALSAGSGKTAIWNPPTGSPDAWPREFRAADSPGSNSRLATTTTNRFLCTLFGSFIGRPLSGIFTTHLITRRIRIHLTSA